jgi:hypothetical protein
MSESALFTHQQVDLATGNCLGNVNTDGWATRFAPLLDTEYLTSHAGSTIRGPGDISLNDHNVQTDDSCVSGLEPDPLANDDADMASDSDSYTPDPDSDESYIPDPRPGHLSSGKKRKAAKQTHSSSHPTLSQAKISAWKDMFERYAWHFKHLHSACSLQATTSTISSDELVTLKEKCTEMIKDLHKLSKSDFSNSEWKKCLRESGFISAFWELRYIHIHPGF